MSRPIVRIHNLETNEIYDGEMPDDQYEIFLENKKIEDQQNLSNQTKAAEKVALLAKLGITDDEAKLLLS